MRTTFEKRISFVIIAFIFMTISVWAAITIFSYTNYGFTLKDTSNQEYNTITVTFSDGNGFFLNPKVVQSFEGVKVNHYPSDSIIFEFIGFDMEIHEVKALFHNGDLFEYDGHILIKR